MNLRARIHALGIGAAALLATLAAGAPGPAIWLHYLCKPLATLLILAWAWRAEDAAPRYRAMITAGMALSACGDAFLMLPEDVYAFGFISGLGSFLIAHLFFLLALTSDTRLFGKPAAPLAFFTLAAINLSVLWNGIPAALRIPVLAYVACLAAMAGQASSRWLGLRNPGTRYAAIGGALFLLSDTLIAYDRFRQALPSSEIWILGSYYAALCFLAGSVAQTKMPAVRRHLQTN